MSLRVVHKCLQSKGDRLAIIICNSPLDGVEVFLKQVWQSCSVVVCADGGSNRLYDTMGTIRSSYIPHVICGDLDSARAEVIQFYKDKGSKIMKIDEQDTTDLTKCINHILELYKTCKVKVDAIVVINAINWGRFDQIMAAIHSLFLISDPSPPVHLLSSDSFITLLPPGQHRIAVDTGLEEGHCGLIPISGTVNSMTTTGLTWNLDHHKLSFEHFIDTNNIIASGTKEVTVDTSGCVLWTISHRLSSYPISSSL